MAATKGRPKKCLPQKVIFSLTYLPGTFQFDLFTGHILVCPFHWEHFGSNIQAVRPWFLDGGAGERKGRGAQVSADF